MDISRVEFFCKDGKVGEVLRLLAGIALETPKVTPVVNAKRKGNHLEQVTHGSTVEMFRAWLGQNKVTEVNSNIGREYCKSVGKRPESYNYLFAAARDEGLLRKTGKGTHSKWKVVQR